MNKLKSLATGLAVLSVSGMAMAADPEVTVSGTVEVELSSSEDYESNKALDINTATVELGVDAMINEHVDAHVLMLYEEGDTPLGLDEGYLTLHMGAMDLTAGQMYVPFGRFDTGMVSDPLTLELGETGDSALMLGTAGDSSLYGALYLYNGDVMEADATDDTDLVVGLNAGYANDMMDIGLGYMSNIADTDLLQGALEEATGAMAVDAYVGGLDVYATLQMGAFSVILEHVAAASAFEIGDFGLAEEKTPSASHVELGMDLGGERGLALTYQMTDDALFLGLPASAAGVAYTMPVYEAASLGFEYMTMADYDEEDGGSGESANALTIQLATSF